MQFLRLLAAISDKFIWDTYIQMKQFHGLAGADLGGGAEGEGEGSFWMFLAKAWFFANSMTKVVRISFQRYWH